MTRYKVIGGSLELEPEEQVSLAPPPVSKVPLLTEYQARASSYGKRHAEYLARTTEPFDPQLDATYYDSIHVYQALRQYLPASEAGWCNLGLLHSIRVYRDNYVIKNNGGLPGYYVFCRGLREHFEATSDAKSKEAVRLIAYNSAYTKDGINTTELPLWAYSREVAYAIQAWLDWYKLSREIRPNFGKYLGFAMGHLDQVLTEKAPHVEAFMVALTCRALSQVYDSGITVIGFDRTKIPSVISRSANWLMSKMWNAQAQAFAYSWALTPDKLTGDGANPAPDLNLLIVPVYSWLYSQQKDPALLQWGNQIWQGGVAKAYLERGKQFNQNYTWSLEYPGAVL